MERQGDHRRPALSEPAVQCRPPAPGPLQDVVLAVGTRLDNPQLEWGLDDDLKIIRIDIDAAQITNIATPEIAIVADAKSALSDLVTALARHSIARKSRREELTGLKAAMFRKFEQDVGPQMRILKVIREELPEDGFLVDEVTQVGYASWYGFPVYQPRHFISSGYQGNLGYGYTTALGVQIAHPDKKVVVLGGDGGFMYQATEMANAVKYRPEPGEHSLQQPCLRQRSAGPAGELRRQRYRFGPVQPGFRTLRGKLRRPGFPGGNNRAVTQSPASRIQGNRAGIDRNAQRRYAQPLAVYHIAPRPFMKWCLGLPPVLYFAHITRVLGETLCWAY